MIKTRWVGLIGLVGWSLAGLACAAAPDRAVGFVFEDRNGNGVRDGDEPGVPGVLVSNGLEVVKTDDQGRYELPISDDTVLFVIKPRDFMTRVDEMKLPRFYYIHRPAGTPDEQFIFKGVGPTGPLPSSVDFPLTRRPEPETFEVVLVADPQAYTIEEINYYTRAVAPEWTKLDVSFGIALGDLVGDNLDLFLPYNQANAVSSFPWYNVIGNHDLNYLAPTDRFSDTTFEKTYGPSTYAFQYGPVHFINFKNVYWPGFEGWRADGWPRRGRYNAELTERQLQFAANYLEHVPTDQTVVLLGHIHWSNPYADDPTAYSESYHKLFAMVSKHDNVVALSGHTHVNNIDRIGPERGYANPSGNTLLHYNVGTASGSWYRGPLSDIGVPLATMSDGTPRGYAVARFENGRFSARFQAFGKPADYQMRIHAPDVVVRGEAVRVQTNVFTAAADSQVEARLIAPDGQTSPWIAKRQTRSTDPHYVGFFERHLAELRKVDPEARPQLPMPRESDHQFVAELPPQTLGVHVIEVRATDAFGATFTSRRPVRVVESQEWWQAFDKNSVRTPRQRPSRQPVDR